MKTKTVNGVQLASKDFAYVGDPEDISTWSLPIDNAGRVRDAMARFSQTSLPASAKAASARKIVARAKELGIDPSGFAKEHQLSSAAGGLFLELSPAVVAHMFSALRADGLVHVPVLMLGNWVQGTKPVAITPDLVDQIVKNFSAQKVDVPLSYEHTIEHPAIAQGQPIPAAGWLKELDDGPDSNGVLWGWAELTAEARGLIQSREYKYLSPAYATKYPNHKTGQDQGATLLSLALTNRPFLPMPAVTCSAAVSESSPASAGKKEKKMLFKKTKVSPITSGEQKGNLLVEHSDIPAKDGDGNDQQFVADPSEVQKAMSDAGYGMTDVAASREGIAKICLLSGVSGATAITPEVVGAITVKVGAAASAPKVITMSAVPSVDGKRDYLRIAVPEGAAVDGEVFRAMQADAELSAAVREGKILPAQRENFEKIALRDIELFRAMVAGMTPQVRLGVNGSSAPGAVELSAEEIEVAKQLGTPLDKLTEAKKLAATL